MQSKIKNGNLVIELPLEKPRPSKTGKTLLVASTRGVKRLEVRYKGKTVSAVVNAFIYPDGQLTEEGLPSKVRLDQDGEEGDDDAGSKIVPMGGSRSCCDG
jgi:hypothetical protein